MHAKEEGFAKDGVYRSGTVRKIVSVQAYLYLFREKFSAPGVMPYRTLTTLHTV